MNGNYLPGKSIRVVPQKMTWGSSSFQPVALLSTETSKNLLYSLSLACGQMKREKANWSWKILDLVQEIYGAQTKKLRCSPFTTLNCLGLETWLENVFYYSVAKMKWLCIFNIVSAINVFLAKVFLPLIKYQSSDEEIVKMEIEWLCIHKPVVMSFLNQKVFK